MDCASCLYVLSDGHLKDPASELQVATSPGLANWHSGEILPLHLELL
jgi:hypothetical protein